LGKLFRAATEKLAEDTLLHILVLPDRGSEGIYKFIIKLGVFSEILEFLYLLIIKLILMVVFQKLILDPSLILIGIFHWMILIIFLIHINIEALFV
jgi:hypothetical protein